MENATHRPNPTLASNQSERARMYEESILRVEELASKRFWTLEPENELGERFLVRPIYTRFAGFLPPFLTKHEYPSLVF